MEKDLEEFVPEISTDEVIFPICRKTKSITPKVRLNGKEIYVELKGYRIGKWQCSLCKLSPRQPAYESDGVYPIKIVTKNINPRDALKWTERDTKLLEIASEGKVKKYNQCYIKKLGNATYITPNGKGVAKRIQAALRKAGWSWTLINNSRELMHSPALGKKETEELIKLLKKIPIPEKRERSQ